MPRSEGATTASASTEPDPGLQSRKMGGCCIYYHHYKHKLKILLRFFLAIFHLPFFFRKGKSEKMVEQIKNLKAFFNEKKNRLIDFYAAH
jgi:hypothetical protein